MSSQVLFLLPYPLKRAPSQRFRVEAFFYLLERDGVQYRTEPFLNEAAWNLLYQKGSLFQKAWAVFKGFSRRLYVILFMAFRYDYIFIHREAAPLGPPVFEWFLTIVLGKKIIFDFDDAIWIPNVSESNKVASWMKCFWKIRYICRWSYKISAGNAYLAKYAGQFNHNIVIVPTCVDTEKRYTEVKKQATTRPVIGWTGSHSTLKYLDTIVPVLQNLEDEYDFDFLVICNERPDFELRSLKFLYWQESSEINDLLRINIGVMPLIQDAWSEGKCGFKIIQYLSLGIPAVASPVGVNKTIVSPGNNGFLCNSKEEWREALAHLVTHETLRVNLGKQGRETIEKHYSIRSNYQHFSSLFS